MHVESTWLEAWSRVRAAAAPLPLDFCENLIMRQTRQLSLPERVSQQKAASCRETALPRTLLTVQLPPSVFRLQQSIILCSAGRCVSGAARSYVASGGRTWKTHQLSTADRLDVSVT
eukprot:3398930-Rhodomonas_salina.1